MKVISKGVFKLYREWYFKKFNNAVRLKRPVKVKALGYKAIAYKRMLIATYRAISKGSDGRFIQYLDFIFEAWKNCKGTIESDFPSWLFSSKMISRFEGSMAKESLTENHNSPTYSDHSYAGNSRDSDVSFEDLGDMSTI